MILVSDFFFELSRGSHDHEISEILVAADLECRVELVAIQIADSFSDDVPEWNHITPPALPHARCRLPASRFLDFLPKIFLKFFAPKYFSQNQRAQFFECGSFFRIEKGDAPHEILPCGNDQIVFVLCCDKKQPVKPLPRSSIG